MFYELRFGSAWYFKLGSSKCFMDCSSVQFGHQKSHQLKKSPKDDDLSATRRHLEHGLVITQPQNPVDEITYPYIKYLLVAHDFLSSRWQLSGESCHYANFFVPGGIDGCRYDNHWCYQWRQSWYHDDYRFTLHTSKNLDMVTFQLCDLIESFGISRAVTRKT